VNGSGRPAVPPPGDGTPPAAEGAAPAERVAGAAEADVARLDPARVRSFIGLSVGLVGPRANLAVSGVLLTLYVQQRASTALAVTFALTARRLVSWVTFPLAGRLSDRTRSHLGRRTPYMGSALVLLGAATWMYTVVHGYWQLVLVIVIAGQAASVFTLTNVTVVPEVFGRSRWIKALLLTTVLGTLASLSIKGTVIATWKQSDPATWNLPFQVAAVIMASVGLLVILLVRESPAATFGAASDRGHRAVALRGQLEEILRVPNARVLIAGSLLFWSGVGSTAYVAILFFQRVVHAGAGAQTIAGLATGLPAFFIGIALGVPLSRLFTVRQLAIGAPLVGSVLVGVQYFDSHIWQAVVLSYIGAPVVGAYLIALAPMLLQLLPRGGGLGERLGILISPFNLCSVALAYVAAAVIDATGNYRLIWLFPAVTGLAHGIVNCWLRIPVRRQAGPDPVTRLWEWSVVQAEALSETGIVTGLLAAPLMGVVTKEDADSAVVVDLARNILGNPYEDEDGGPGRPDGEDGGAGRPDGQADDPGRPGQAGDGGAGTVPGPAPNGPVTGGVPEGGVVPEPGGGDGLGGSGPSASPGSS
jgi:Na+/melibiose symporter-like transporter